jgi:Flp pilus assembly pilin Flp
MKRIHLHVTKYAVGLLLPVRRFWNDTSGAVTVDWVVLTAAVLAMVTAFMAGFSADVNGFLVTLMASL